MRNGAGIRGLQEVYSATGSPRPRIDAASEDDERVSFRRGEEKRRGGRSKKKGLESGAVCFGVAAWSGGDVMGFEKQCGRRARDEWRESASWRRGGSRRNRVGTRGLQEVHSAMGRPQPRSDEASEEERKCEGGGVLTQINSSGCPSWEQRVGGTRGPIAGRRKDRNPHVHAGLADRPVRAIVRSARALSSKNQRSSVGCSPHLTAQNAGTCSVSVEAIACKTVEGNADTKCEQRGRAVRVEGARQAEKRASSKQRRFEPACFANRKSRDGSDERGRPRRRGAVAATRSARDKTPALWRGSARCSVGSGGEESASTRRLRGPKGGLMRPFSAGSAREEERQDPDVSSGVERAKRRKVGKALAAKKD